MTKTEMTLGLTVGRDLDLEAEEKLQKEEAAVGRARETWPAEERAAQ